MSRAPGLTLALLAAVETDIETDGTTDGFDHLGRWMYSNGVRVPNVSKINAQGYLANSAWVWNGSASSYSRGEAIFRGECGSCHTLQSYRPLEHLLEGRDRANIRNFIVMLHDTDPKHDSPYRKFMPPMVGTDQDVSDLTDFLDAQVNPPASSTQKPLLTSRR